MYSCFIPPIGEMCDLQVLMFDRSFRAVELAADLRVADLSWLESGSSDGCEITVGLRRGEVELDWILEWLRYGVKVVNGYGEGVWAGYVHEIQICAGGEVMAVSLEGMANRVAVRYKALGSRTAWAAEDAVTAFVEDGDSAAMYGEKEWIGVLSDARPEEALAAAWSWLENKAFPAVKVGGEVTAGMRLGCRGWWDTLSWKYYQCEAGLVGDVAEGKAVLAFGQTTSNQKFGQKFLVGSDGLKVLEAWIKVGVTGTVADTLVVEIQGDAGGVPDGAAVSDGVIYGDEVSGGLNWKRAVMDGVALPAGVYWVVVRRSGAVDGLNYYEIQVDEGAGYGDGELRLWNGSGWVLQAGDANFAVLGGEEVTAQIERVAAVGGQFLRGVRVLERSAVDGLLWKPLQRRCGEVIQDLLAAGGLSAVVDCEGWLVVG